MSIAAVGDKYFVTIFRLVGIKSFPVENSHEAERKIKEMIEKGNYKVILIPESLASKIKHIRMEVVRSGKPYPVFAIIPGFEGSSKERLNEIYQLINQAVGVKLKFGG